MYSAKFSFIDLHNCAIIKGTVSQDFLLQIFLWIIFLLTPENNIRIISHYFENSQRYLQVKVHHRLSTTSTVNFLPVSTTLVANLPPISATPAVNLPPILLVSLILVPAWVANCHCYQTGGTYWEQYKTAYTLNWIWRKKFIFMLTLLPKGTSWAANISEIFEKLQNGPYRILRGTGGNWFMKKL